MKIKSKEKDPFLRLLKDFFIKILDFLVSKRLFIIYIIILILVVFITGLIFGLLITGFFGTLSAPSKITLDVLHSLGIEDLRNLKLRLEGIANENIKIPLNFVKGKFSQSETLFIDIAFEDYQKLEAQRELALSNGVLISSADDFVPAEITVNEEIYNVKMRLKGDWVDHLQGDKWSFRIKVRDNKTIFGFKTFSIQAPKTRNYLNEFVYHLALKDLGLMSPEYTFVKVYINGDNKGIYALEEHFEPQLIVNSEEREGIILKFNEDPMWQEFFNSQYLFSNETTAERYNHWYYASNIEPFDEDLLLDPYLEKQFLKAQDLLYTFRESKLSTSAVFDIDGLSTYLAINTLFACEHASRWHNIRFYYNPITTKIEPIGFDGDCGLRQDANSVIDSYLGENAEPFYKSLFSDPKLLDAYITKLYSLSNKQFLEAFFEKHKAEKDKNLNILRKDDFLYNFYEESFYNNMEQINLRFNSPKTINVFISDTSSFDGSLKIRVFNEDLFPLKVLSLEDVNGNLITPLESNTLLSNSLGNIKTLSFIPIENFILNDSIYLNFELIGTDINNKQRVLPWKDYKTTELEKDVIRNPKPLDELEFIIKDESTKTIRFVGGSWKLNETLIIPEGYTVFAGPKTEIDLTNKASIISYSKITFFGSKEFPIKISSMDKTGQGFVVLSAKEKSVFQNVIFQDLVNPDLEGWELTGAVTFYESPFEFDNVIIKGMNSEDSLDGVRSSYTIRNSQFEDCLYDCFDDDFGGGGIINTIFVNCGGDCLDISGTTVNTEGLIIKGAGDKGISSGEESQVFANNTLIQGIEGKQNFIGVASKDRSFVLLNNITIENSLYGLAVYEKKSEFGPSSMEANNVNFINIENKYIVEKKSKLILDKLIVLGGYDKVYELLYGENAI